MTTPPDRNLKPAIERLEARVDRLESLISRALGSLALLGLAAALVLPLWSYKKGGESEHDWLLEAFTQWGNGVGAVLRSVIVIGVIAAIVAAIVAVRSLMSGREYDGRDWRGVAIELCAILVLGVWAVTLVAGMQKNDDSANLIGPGLVALTAGAALAVLAERWESAKHDQL